MKILIDTNVFIWLTSEPNKLGQSARNLIDDRINELSISYISFFEMTIKAAAGKLPHFDVSVLDDLEPLNMTLLTPTTVNLKNYTIYNPDNRDPFDNMLLTVALQENLTFMTSDHKILNLLTSGLRLLDACA